MLFMRGGSEQQLDYFEGADSMFARPMASMYRPRIFGRPDPRITYQGCPVITRAEVKLGSDSGGLAFVPDSLTVKSGEEVKFVNNAGFPHNIVFDEDGVPEGVNVEKISKEDYLNAAGETYSVKFDKAGEYNYYCEPHRGAGMKGKIIVQ